MATKDKTCTLRNGSTAIVRGQPIVIAGREVIVGDWLSPVGGLTCGLLWNSDGKNWMCRELDIVGGLEDGGK